MIEKGKLRINIPVQNILFIKSEHVYCRLFFINNQKVLQRISLEKLLDKLPEDTFIRVHRSFLVNVNHISKFNHSKVMVGDTVIPIGRTWKEKVVPVLKQVLS